MDLRNWGWSGVSDEVYKQEKGIRGIGNNRSKGMHYKLIYIIWKHLTKKVGIKYIFMPSPRLW